MTMHTAQAAIAGILTIAGLATHAQVRQDTRFDYGRYNTPTSQTFNRELQLRNSLVTGNAPGGFSFRETVGYTAPREFRGDLASDDLFAFRRDSISSGVSGLGIRGTEGLQYQFGLTAGNRVNNNIARSFTFSRGSTFQAVRGVNTFDPQNAAINRWGQPQLDVGNTLDSAVNPARPASNRNITTNQPVQVRPTTIQPSTMVPTRVEPIDINQSANQPDGMAGLWTLRSTAGYLTTSSLAGRFLAQQQTPDGRIATIIASPLTGIETLYDDPRESVPTPDPSTNAPALLQSRVESRSETFGRIETAFQSALPNNTPAEEDSETEQSQVNPTLDPFRNFLNQQDPDERSAATIEQPDRPDLGFRAPTAEDAAERRRQLEAELEAELTEPAREDARDRLIRQLEALGVSEETLKTMRDQRLEIDTLVPPSQRAVSDLYSIHMQTAERLLRQNRYFEAEARYTMALAERPEDPVAAAARVHAAMGAGLYVSAATNLRILLSDTPELIPVRYSDRLLPPDERLARVISDLTDLTSKTDGKVAETSALPILLAYVGYHAQNDEALQLGLARMTATNDQRLRLLLQLIWLDETSAENAIRAVGADDAP